MTEQDRNYFESFVQLLFDELKRTGIEYCVERNYEDLPYHVDNDVDIVVREDQFSKFHDILLKVARLRGWSLIMNIKSCGGARCYFGHFGSGQMHLLRIDPVHRLHWKGMDFISAEHVLADRVPHNAFYIPSAGAEAAISLLLRLVYHGYVKESYKEHIRNLVNTEPHVFSSIISHKFGDKWATEFLERVNKSDWDGIQSSTSTLRRRLFFGNLCRRPIGQVLDWIRYMTNRMQRFFNPVGLFVVMLGPDGSGKSTVANKLVLNLKPIFQTERAKILHWRPGLLPPIRRLFGHRNGKEDEDFTRPHQAKPYSRPVSLMRFLYYTMDFILGYYSKVHFMKAKGMLVVIDRYYYDFLVDAYRYRLDLPDWFLRLFLKVIPRPDMVFYLHCNPEILRERKKELSVEELNRQVDEFQKLLHKLPNSIGVDANRSLYEVVNEVTRTLLDSAIRRAERSR